MLGAATTTQASKNNFIFLLTKAIVSVTSFLNFRVLILCACKSLFFSAWMPFLFNQPLGGIRRLPATGRQLNSRHCCPGYYCQVETLSRNKSPLALAVRIRPKTGYYHRPAGYQSAGHNKIAQPTAG